MTQKTYIIALCMLATSDILPRCDGGRERTTEASGEAAERRAGRKRQGMGDWRVGKRRREGGREGEKVWKSVRERG